MSEIRLEYPLTKVASILKELATKSEFKYDIFALDPKTLVICTTYDNIAKITLEPVKEKFKTVNYKIIKNIAVLETDIELKKEFLDYLKEHLTRLERKYNARIGFDIDEKDKLYVLIQMQGVGLYVYKTLSNEILKLMNQYARSIIFKGAEIEIEGNNGEKYYSICMGIYKRGDHITKLQDLRLKL